MRSLAKGQHILDSFPGGKVTLAEVKDIVTGEGLEEAMKGEFGRRANYRRTIKAETVL